MSWEPMSRAEAEDVLAETPKDNLMEPELFDRMKRLIENGDTPLSDILHLNEHGEIVTNGGLSVDGDEMPWIRFSRGD